MTNTRRISFLYPTNLMCGLMNHRTMIIEIQRLSSNF